MEKKEKKQKEYQQKMGEIEKCQELIGMLEAIIVLGKYLPDEEKKMNRFYGISGDQDLLPIIDLAHQTFYKTFYKMLPDLLKNDFVIDLSFKRIYKSKLGNCIENIDDEKNDILEKEYNNLTISYDKFIYNFFKDNDECKIDLIDFLIENDMYEVVTNLLISYQVSGEQKFNILVKSLEHHDSECFNKLLNTIPSTYKPHKYANKEQEFNDLLFDNLSELREKYKIANNYFNEFVKGYICDRRDKDSLSKWNLEKAIKNLIQFNLIDINELLFYYNGEEITSAGAAYIYGESADLAFYLYELPSYKKIDSEIKDNTDMLLLKLGYKHSKNNFDWLINRKNFNNTCDKMLYILDFIDRCNSGKCCFDYHYTEEDINEIMDVLIRKTKKEDYKEVKRGLENRKRNQLLEEQKQLLEKQEQALLTQKRQEFTSLLRILDDTLLETVPAKKKIKEINFKK